MVGKNHFDPHKSENDDEAITDIGEFVQHIRHQKIHRPMTQDSQSIAAKHNKCISCIRQYRSDTIHSKYDIRKFEHDQSYKKWRSIFYTFFSDKKMRGICFMRQRKYLSDPAHRFGRCRIIFLIFAREHQKSREEQKSSKNIADPVKPIDQSHSKNDHDRPENNSTQYPIKQHLMLIFPGNTKRGKDESDDKYIVHTQGKLDQITSDVFDHCIFGGQSGGVRDPVVKE